MTITSKYDIITQKGCDCMFKFETDNYQELKSSNGSLIITKEVYGVEVRAYIPNIVELCLSTPSEFGSCLIEAIRQKEADNSVIIYEVEDIEPSPNMHFAWEKDGKLYHYIHHKKFPRMEEVFCFKGKIEEFDMSRLKHQKLNKVLY